MKYRKKPIVIDAEPYHEGLEDGWKVYFSGNGDIYERSFIKKQDADYFIKNDIGLSYVNDDDRNYGNLIYETPVPIIKTLEGYMDIKYTDYIITGVRGERYPCKKAIFEETYEQAK